MSKKKQHHRSSSYSSEDSYSSSDDKQVMTLIPLIIPPERNDAGTLPQKILLEKGVRENITEGINKANRFPI